MPRTPRIRPIAIALTAFAALALAGCANDTPSGPTVPMGPPPATTEAAETTAAADEALAGLEGTWCPTDDSEGDPACFTVEGEELLVDGGPAWLEARDEGDGTYSLSLTDETGPLEPYGFFAPAGTPAGINDEYGIADQPDVDRIFNSQTGVLYVAS